MAFFKGINCCIVAVGQFLQPFFLLAIRILWGLGFFFAGYGKFSNIENVVNFFTELGIIWPEFSAYLVATVEAVGGILLIIGFASRFASVFLTIVMCTALCTAHVNAVFGMFSNFQDNFQEFSTQAPVAYLLTALTVWCFGAGLFSIDAIIRKVFCKQGRD